MTDKNREFWATWRKLKDTRAAPLLEGLRLQWLGLDDEGTPPSGYPAQTVTLRAYAAREMPDLFARFA